MRRILTALLLLAVCGCWTPGAIVEGLPKHTVKFPPETSFFVEPGEPHVTHELKTALAARGFPLKDRREEADIVLTVKVEGWEFNDAGFSGFYDRNDMQLAITLSDPRTKRIHARANVTVRSDFHILAKYVDTL